VLHHLGPQVGDELAGRQPGILGGDLVGQPTEVEVMAAQFGHERVLGIASGHGHVRDHLAGPPALAQRRRVPLLLGGRVEQVSERQEVRGHQ
jgi:hypothetical protein